MFARTQSDGVWLGAGYVPSAADWQDLNTKIFRAVNGQRGGTWAPTGPIAFPSGGFNVTAPVELVHGGELQVDTVDLDGASKWPVFGAGHALRERTIVQLLLARQSTPREHWVVDTATAAIQSVALGVQPTDRSRLAKPARFRVELDVHDSATLRTAVLTFTVPVKRNAAPYGMPKMRIVRVDESGNAKPLASTAVGADGAGWQSPAKITSVERWYNAGLAQTFTYVCDQNNVIDVSQFMYFAEIEDEDIDPVTVLPALIDGKAIREQKLDVDYATAATLSAASLSGNLSIDGVTTSPGLRVLVMHGINNDPVGTRYMNGIWVTGTPWTRAPDLDNVLDVTKDFFVYVKYGVQNKGTLWQIAAPYPTEISSSSSLGGTANVAFERFVPSGNKYHSLGLHFDGIAEMRWQ